MIILDTGVLGLLCHRTAHLDVVAVRKWLTSLQDQHIEVAIPEIADYELRRSLLRIGSTKSIATLETIEATSTYLPITTEVMRIAANLWAESRRNGLVTGPDSSLDGDVILAALALSEQTIAHPVLVATTNLRHLQWFVAAEKWTSIDPESQTYWIHRRW
jgi:predicted nucleic acid-binding protein